jgi:hypothetical protein
MRSAFFIAVVVAYGCGATEKSPRSDTAQTTAVQPPIPTSSNFTCGIGPTTKLDGNGVGELQVGRTVDNVKRLCNVVQDTTDLGAEGMPERVMLLTTSRGRLEATIDSGRVWRIAIDQPDLRTADSIGVGSSLSRLLREGNETGAEGEGVLYVLPSNHCGLSLGLDYEVTDREHRDTWSKADLRKIPQDSRVSRVLITGCQKK